MEFHTAVVRRLLNPDAQVLHERIQIRLAAKINRLFIFTNLNKLRPSSDIRDPEIVIVGSLLPRAGESAVEDVLAETRFLRKSAGKTHAINSFESLVHCSNRLEAASDVRLRFGEDRSDQLRELEEETLALLSRIALMSECELLECSASKLDKVKPFLLKNAADFPSLFRVETFLLELD